MIIDTDKGIVLLTPEEAELLRGVKPKGYDQSSISTRRDAAFARYQSELTKRETKFFKP